MMAIKILKISDMKKLSLLIMLILAGMLTFNSCQKEEFGPVLGTEYTSPAITAPLTGSTLVLTKPQATSDSVTFKWSPADYGLSLAVNYTLQIAKAGSDFATPVAVKITPDDSIRMSYGDFNTKLVALECNMDVANDVELRVKAEVPGTAVTVLYSPVIDMTVTPYTAKDNYYLVGAFNGWNTTTSLVFNRNLPGLKYEVYVNIPADDQNNFKVLTNQANWDGDIGDDPANPGKLISTGEQNMWAWPAGYYRVKMDLQAMTWSTLKTDWGLIGSATPDGWNSDQNLTYDDGTKTWTITLDLVAGAIKFRANDSWDLNFGDTGANGSLEEGGTDISVASDGNYTITLNLNPTGNPQVYTYTVVKN
jgi:hypothetical protein